MKRPLIASLAVAVIATATTTAAYAQNFFSQLKVDSLVGQAIDLYRRGDFAGSLDRLGTAIALSPNDVQAHYDRGLALYALSRYGDAADEFNACLRQQPDLVPAQFNLGVTDLALNDLDGAKTIFTQ